MKKNIAPLVLTLVGLSGCTPSVPAPEKNALSDPQKKIAESPFRNGTYQQRQTYEVEGHTFYIDLSADIEDGKIIALSVDPDPNGKNAIRFAEEYANAFQEKLKGKTMSEAKKLVYVSGASSTTKAFQEGLTAIEEQASQNKE